MTWNYRIVKYKDGSGYGLHEVYYNKDGEVHSMTTEPASFACGDDEGVGGVMNSLRMAYQDATTRPILDEPEKFAKPDWVLD